MKVTNRVGILGNLNEVQYLATDFNENMCRFSFLNQMWSISVYKNGMYFTKFLSADQKKQIQIQNIDIYCELKYNIRWFTTVTSEKT